MIVPHIMVDQPGQGDFRRDHAHGDRLHHRQAHIILLGQGDQRVQGLAAHDVQGEIVFPPDIYLAFALALSFS